MDSFNRFNRICRKAHLYTDEESKLESVTHPFDEREIHSALPPIVKNLFDDGYFAQATFEAFKYLEREISRVSKIKKSGWNLMLQAFDETNPKIKLNNLSSESEIDEQRGYRYMFGGSICGIRNPRGHDYKVSDKMDECLDHLSLVSLLLRKIENIGIKLKIS